MNNCTAVTLQYGELTYCHFERLAPEAIAIRFDGEWLLIEKGSLSIVGPSFTCMAGARFILGKTRRIRALGFEAES